MYSWVDSSWIRIRTLAVARFQVSGSPSGAGGRGTAGSKVA